MIFATVGTTQYPFDRLFQCLDEAVSSGQIKEEIYAQIGSSNYRPANFAYCEFLGHSEMLQKIMDAHIVISHAGIGTFLTCFNHGKIPILFPRKPELGEHVDNHQREFLTKMSDSDKFVSAVNEYNLIRKVVEYDEIVSRVGFFSDNSQKKRLVNCLRNLLA